MPEAHVVQTFDELGPWCRQGLCRDYDVDTFFPVRGAEIATAKAICGRCSVEGECREYALSQPLSLSGVWGGTTQRQRRAMKRRRTATQLEEAA